MSHRHSGGGDLRTHIQEGVIYGRTHILTPWALVGAKKCDFAQILVAPHPFSNTGNRKAHF